jgi:hypothetical protein
MIHINIDPYDMLIQHNVRIGLLETTLRDTQQQLLEITKIMREQTQLIKQLKNNENEIGRAVQHLLTKTADETAS